MASTKAEIASTEACDSTRAEATPEATNDEDDKREQEEQQQGSNQIIRAGVQNWQIKAPQLCNSQVGGSTSPPQSRKATTCNRTTVKQAATTLGTPVRLLGY
ncbi:hypothetical protein E3N88_20127 [Mikania micrantha]|uniref:Uncharacterized protein n=1 Tax=Mikania micrantha TaxID=192012 RepID=A0A5N6NGL0_9ASTR|nr:hypothetical protein E3N88_20127 [Mikania micrantha]